MCHQVLVTADTDITFFDQKTLGLKKLDRAGSVACRSGCPVQPRWRRWPVSFTLRSVRMPLEEAVTRMMPQ